MMKAKAGRIINITDQASLERLLAALKPAA
jgi:hypothetical protein